MTAINRPWMSSFQFQNVPFSETALEQFHKLARNYVASLDLGCPSAKHVKLVGIGEDLTNADDRTKYLAWVKNWKYLYRELSQIIRMHKKFRKTIHFPKLSGEEMELWQRLNRDTNQRASQHLRGLSQRHLERLQETAMVLLNGRYNAKLASAERRRRAHETMMRELTNLAQEKTEAVVA